MKTCIILHNMVVEHRRNSYSGRFHCQPSVDEAHSVFGAGPVQFTWNNEKSISDRMGSPLPQGMRATLVSSRNARISDSAAHFSLKSDLIEHIWRQNSSRSSQTNP